MCGTGTGTDVNRKKASQLFVFRADAIFIEAAVVEYLEYNANNNDQKPRHYVATVCLLHRFFF